MNYQRLEELFHDALELAPTRRAAFLDEVAATNPELRRELEELLELARSGTSTHLRVPQIHIRAETPDIIGSHIDHYMIMREIGRGGMGTVFEARDTKLNRPVALKLLHAHQGADNSLFLREAQVTARCRHENIVVIHDAGLHDDSPYMALEYLEGTSLRHEMHRPPASERAQRRPSPTPAMPLGRIVELMTPVLRALLCAHEQHVIHCDLKPENIFVTNKGIIKVLDFGIARAIADTVNLRNMTSGRPGGRQDGLLVGTPLYMSPEQWGVDSVDARSDIWAVGLMLYEMATGGHPLVTLPPAELPERVTDLDQPIPPIAEAAAGLGVFGELVDDCLRKRKEERIQSVDTLLERFQRLSSGRLSGTLSGKPVAASPSGDSTFLLEICDVDVQRCNTFERSRIAEQEHARDLEALDGYRELLHEKAAQGSGSEKVERLQGRLDCWMRYMPGELLCKRRERGQDALVLLLTIRNLSARQAILHTVEVDLFERDWLSRGLPGPTTRLLEPLVEYAFEVREPRDSFPMIPNIAIAPDDVVSFHVKLDVRFYRYSLRLRVSGSSGGQVETQAIHVR